MGLVTESQAQPIGRYPVFDLIPIFLIHEHSIIRVFIAITDEQCSEREHWATKLQ